jgi:hypothetical protein
MIKTTLVCDSCKLEITHFGSKVEIVEIVPSDTVVLWVGDFHGSCLNGTTIQQFRDIMDEAGSVKRDRWAISIEPLGGE